MSFTACQVTGHHLTIFNWWPQDAHDHAEVIAEDQKKNKKTATNLSMQFKATTIYTNLLWLYKQSKQIQYTTLKLKYQMTFADNNYNINATCLWKYYVYAYKFHFYWTPEGI